MWPRGTTDIVLLWKDPISVPLPRKREKTGGMWYPNPNLTETVEKVYI